MTHSIHNHRSSSLYFLDPSKLQSTGTDSATESDSSAKSISARLNGTDSLSISSLAYSALQAGGGLYASGYSAGYSNEESSDSLTVGEKKSMLADLQSKLSSLETTGTSDTDAAAAEAASTDTADNGNPLQKTLAALKTSLSGKDLSAMSDDDISSLFDSVSKTIGDNRPARPPGPPPMGMGSLGGMQRMSGLSATEGDGQQMDGLLGLDDNGQQSDALLGLDDSQQVSDLFGSDDDDQQSDSFQAWSRFQSMPPMPPVQSGGSQEKTDGRKMEKTGNADSGLPSLLRAMGGFMHAYSLNQTSGSGSTDSEA